MQAASGCLGQGVQYELMCESDDVKMPFEVDSCRLFEYEIIASYAYGKIFAKMK